MSTRLDQMVAQRAGISRRDACKRIVSGHVAIDGELCRDPAVRVGPQAALLLDGVLIKAPPRLALLHKPLGVHSTVTDPYGRPCLSTVARELLSLGLHPVGRLDADTDGLLPFSLDGALTQHLLHPRRAIVRIYAATVSPTPSDDLIARLAQGIATADGTYQATVLSLREDIVTLSVTEGKHRMVRRMLANAGYPVIALRRLQFGPLVLGDLAAGSWREATLEELALLP